MRNQRLTKFDDAKKAAKSLPGSILRRDGDSGWIIAVQDSVVESKATSADPVAYSLVQSKATSADPVADSVVEPKATSAYSGVSRLCELCGKPIHADRIEALPNTTKCVECQNADEHRKDTDNDDMGSCPRCGCPLVWRHGAPAGSTTKYFIGCSAFPKCRYTTSR